MGQTAPRELTTQSTAFSSFFSLSFLPSYPPFPHCSPSSLPLLLFSSFPPSLPPASVMKNKSVFSDQSILCFAGPICWHLVFVCCCGEAFVRHYWVQGEIKCFSEHELKLMEPLYRLPLQHNNRWTLRKGRCSVRRVLAALKLN